MPADRDRGGSGGNVLTSYAAMTAPTFHELDLGDVRIACARAGAGLPRIHVPVLLLYGALDLRSPPSVARALHAAIPGCALAFIPGVGHVANAEAPAIFNAYVRGFIRGNGSPP